MVLRKIPLNTMQALFRPWLYFSNSTEALGSTNLFTFIYVIFGNKMHQTQKQNLTLKISDSVNQNHEVKRNADAAQTKGDVVMLL